MKTIGIIGGIGPETTIAYYGQIVAAHRERTSTEAIRQS
jgi:aspartate/glutamate racemase